MSDVNGATNIRCTYVITIYAANVISVYVRTYIRARYAAVVRVIIIVMSAVRLVVIVFVIAAVNRSVCVAPTESLFGIVAAIIV